MTATLMTDIEIKRVSPPEAASVLAKDPKALLVDVRSKVEFDYVGHPDGAVNVIWKDYPDWNENSEFVTQVTAALADRDGDPHDCAILAICRSGVRSMAAATVLAGAGYTNLYNVEEGFEGDKDAAGHRRLEVSRLAVGPGLTRQKGSTRQRGNGSVRYAAGFDSRTCPHCQQLPNWPSTHS